MLGSSLKVNGELIQSRGKQALELSVKSVQVTGPSTSVSSRCSIDYVFRLPLST